MLDRSLLGALVKLSHGGLLKVVPLGISATRARVWLKAASKDGGLTFAQVGGDKSVDFEWEALPVRDRGTLAVLVAKLKPGSKEAQALAAIYMESTGRVREADSYFEQAGPEAQRKLEKGVGWQSHGAELPDG